MALVCVKELDTRSIVQFSTSWDQFYSYGTHVGPPFPRGAFAHERRLRPRDPPRSSQRPRRYRCRTRTCASRHARKDTAAKRPERFSLSQTRAAGRWKDHAPRALAIDAFQPRRSPLSRFSAAERRSREHGSDHTDVCHHDDTLATLLLATNLLQPPSAAKGAQILQLAAGQWVSASAAVTRWVLG